MYDDEMHIDALVARADMHFSSLRMTEAAACYRMVLAVRPFNEHVLHRMGLTCVHLNDLDQARAYIDGALQVAPHRADLWEHAGLLAALNSQFGSAETYYLRALGLAGDSASLHRNLADRLRQSGRFGEAIMHYEKSLEIEPGLRHASRALAGINAELGNVDKAVVYWMRTWLLQPAASKDDLDSIVAITDSSHVATLDKTIREIRTRFSDDTAAINAVVYVLIKSHRYEEAFAAAQQGLAVDQYDAVLCQNAAWALRTLGRVAECRAYSQKAALALPDNPVVQYRYSGVLLCLGEFEEGWRRHKSFYEIPENRVVMAWPDFPEWKGESVSGCQFLLVGEQGLGDQIQFLRFAQWLYLRGATVDVLVDTPIAALATSMSGVRHVFTAMPPGPYDYWCHMFSVPEHMKLDLPMLPVVMPYLAPNPTKVRYWQASIEAVSARGASAGKRRIGIVWAGDPRPALDRFRSIQFDKLNAVFALPDITWFSVQKGAKERETEGLARQFDVHTLGPGICDFTDTLAILHALDLLITVDTSVAHLAGAAGLPVWVLVPAYTDWRWMTERKDTPWYPSMRLFRQRNLGEWDTVIEEVRNALQEWCAVRSDATMNS
ncbi:tetratricopeptide repeat protein [Paraburkholderia panacisoli]|nr:tetratricopeptide repeat-containing glycosyltransferase family protein [Paraburkholderia panacisoli]